MSVVRAIAGVLLVLPWQATAQSLNEKALREVERFAQSMCGEYAVSGERRTFKTDGEISGELNAFIRRFVNLGGRVQSNFEADSYEGVLQEELREAIQDSRSCRERIWDDLKQYVIYSPQAESRSSPHAPPLQVPAGFRYWEERTRQYTLQPGETLEVYGSAFVQEPGLPEPSCATGYVIYSWQIRDPFPGGEVEARAHVRQTDGLSEQVGLGSQGHGLVGWCNGHFLQNIGTEAILLELRYASALDWEQLQ